MIPTLRQVWVDYQHYRDLKPKTLRNYNYRIDNYLADWLDLPITEITRQMVEERHRSIVSHSAANYSLRTLKAMLEFACAKYEDEAGVPVLQSNPVNRLTQLKCWHREKPRQDVINPSEFPALFEGLYALANHTARDAILLMLFTGMRRSEVLQLTWDRVDLRSGVITLRGTKNGLDFFCPMSTFVRKLLIQRWLLRVEGAAFVFPGDKRGRKGDSHSSFQGGSTSLRLIQKKTGIYFTPHTCRRTYASVGDDLEIKNEVISACLNHYRGSVTENYVIRSIERLRRATQLISDAILAYAAKKTPPSRNQITAEQRAADLRERAALIPLPPAGSILIRSGKAPFGFCSTGGQLRRDEDECETLLLIRELHQRGEDYRRIANHLNETSRITRHKKPWTYQTVRNIVVNVLPRVQNTLDAGGTPGADESAAAMNTNR